MSADLQWSPEDIEAFKRGDNSPAQRELANLLALRLDAPKHVVTFKGELGIPSQHPNDSLVYSHPYSPETGGWVSENCYCSPVTWLTQAEIEMLMRDRFNGVGCA